ncbi:hypothetical protein GE061_007875 [Apolygus lucorum]|uniref:Uncharacterized protein n=1 Tax=Apolygus lucorum TaxID=248454 RepID=A0A8S9WPS2_APOLU|nr:hypothetical protein GE061_007875 [Apolygus lucorum]
MNLPELEATGGRTALGEMPLVNSERPKKKKPKVNSTVDNNALAAWWGARASAAGSCRNIKDELTPNASDSITYEVDVHEFTSQTASGECDPLEIDNALADADPISYEPPVKTIKVEKSHKNRRTRRTPS